MSKIAIISERAEVIASLEAKLVLLRENDSIVKCKTSEMYKQSANCDIILFHTDKIDDITLTAISNLKKPNNALILLSDEIDSKALLNAYDTGANDFCATTVTNFELLIKIINAKKALKCAKTIERFKKQLRDKGVMKQNSDIYTHINEVVNANFYAEILNATILAISIEDNTDIEPRLQTLLRASDFIINYDDYKYLLILPETELKNGEIVFEKLKKRLGADITGILFKYNEESSKELLSKLKRLEIQREEQKLTLLTDDKLEETESDWLMDEKSETGNFKLFQNIYNNKSENVIEPAFYRTKQKYEKNFQNTKIKYYTDKNRAEFLLINFDQTNSFQIIYKNSAKVGIQMQYSGLDAPENETFELPFSKLNIRSLCDLLEKFINIGAK
ncbi:MAG: hypothetical protein NC390_01510 [Fusobacterium sp.]|nr:hypothetical protein [Fusobacterium sp.]